MSEEEKTMLEEFVKNCSQKNEAYIFGPQLNRVCKKLYCRQVHGWNHVVYTAAMFLAQQQQMSSRRGHGSVNFALLDRIHQTQVLGVTEVKKDDHVQVLAQMNESELRRMTMTRESFHASKVIRHCNGRIQIDVCEAHIGGR